MPARKTRLESRIDESMSDELRSLKIGFGTRLPARSGIDALVRPCV